MSEIEQLAAALGHDIWRGRCSVCGDASVVLTQDADMEDPEPEVCNVCRKGVVSFARWVNPLEAHDHG